MTETKRITVPGTDLEITPLNLGGNTFGWTSDTEESFAVLDAFLAAGGNFIDTADMYSQWGEGHSGGESETVLGQWFAERGNRDQVVLATKVGALQGAEGLAHDTVVSNLDDSLKRLQTEVIDLYYFHYDDESVAIADQVRTAAALVDSGKVRYIGLSNYSTERMREFFETARELELDHAIPLAIQPQYSLLSRAGYEDGYMQVAEEYGVGVFSYFSLASGLLTGKYRSREDLEGAAREGQTGGYFEKDADPFSVVEAVLTVAEAHSVEPASVALAWLLAKGVTAPIASARTPEQVAPLIAATTLELTEDEVATLDAASSSF
ncbi:MAG: aldo/keto reductase [Corynebacterium sp.]|uniref:aldo/keto reductase n=1 Tax=unclassified Corynebacterium TaxID=2624378 RepID=UPI002647AB41|nr:aldo/keto reductase [Corynebacterium sp.]MDN5582267.1 aldo/keto reductase [Corynebacterium sp.]MDN5719595.1 aldo/keto reductase [Corynebacterium sp.]MDN6324005.1 aldo/keto reductase [Corynebacterium sp.]MDN6386927.1 aldo/keto reductase [Corynebacterium sp.]MDN6509712.1 aldo/keto reductase [Corynebacterium sp.]